MRCFVGLGTSEIHVAPHEQGENMPTRPSARRDASSVARRPGQPL
jgi:hypothetical protein